ncbi:hypothetical protein DPEC_G00052900 [Dallia pectoralis]|uniref:Uncharacterized protein n=1 Tax=Dallia pectoralis TaxID=75939 RepID=A0ACC2HD20_DALPE|nr:hypothetical protein DPEC_G00052900 [Dallia pectoralis]
MTNMTTELPCLNIDQFEDCLLSDDVLVHFLNYFLSLPSFPESVQYNRETGVFEVVSDRAEAVSQEIRSDLFLGQSQPPSDRAEQRPVVDNEYPVRCLDRDQGVKWIIKERLPLFIRSDCYFEYRLAKLLFQWVPGGWTQKKDGSSAQQLHSVSGTVMFLSASMIPTVSISLTSTVSISLTSTVSSSLTSTVSSSLTSTVSISLTSTVSISLTSTVSISLTSTVSSSLTSTVSISLTSTVSISLTSTVSISLTSTVLIPNSVPVEMGLNLISILQRHLLRRDRWVRSQTVSPASLTQTLTLSPHHSSSPLLSPLLS